MQNASILRMRRVCPGRRQQPGAHTFSVRRRDLSGPYAGWPVKCTGSRQEFLMYKCLLPTIAAIAAVAAPASAQIQRRATITGNGRADAGKCTVEVVVDGAAEVDI